MRAWALRGSAVPLLLAVLVWLAGAQVALVSSIPSWANDEAPYVGYVAHLAEGRLPTIDSPIVADPGDVPRGARVLLGWDAAHKDTWVANHPPFYVALLVPVWELTRDDVSHVVIAMRLVNTAGYGVWVLLVGLLTRALVPRRPAVAALATIVAVTPSLVLRSGFAQSDGWGSAAALLLLLMTVRMLHGGPEEVTRRRVVVAALAGTLAAGTRAPGVLAVAACAIALGLAWLLSRRAARRPRYLVAAAVVGGVPAAATSWWYLRNLSLYGDLTGQGALLEKFQRSPVTSLADLGRVPGFDEPILAASVAVVVGLLVVPVLAVRRLPLLPGAWRAGWRPDPGWLLLGSLSLVTFVNTAGFVRDGGGFHDRYTMQVIAFLATPVALAMVALLRPRREVARDGAADWRRATGWSVVMTVWTVGGLAVLEWSTIFSYQQTYPAAGPWPWVLGLGALAAAAAVPWVMRERTRHEARREREAARPAATPSATPAAPLR
ncbi:hypothetical protein [Nocardioides bruguierae]|uniref:hypothetical protein n=1 Tax=Nocardioides bruguierae TaxID=2945102 RepID=UPI0020217C06|nr:hypothetical protein [Nocardioides bruguierae]MCL8025117.1 hypothetical protein [Nocardioides bruguierae]